MFTRVLSGFYMLLIRFIVRFDCVTYVFVGCYSFHKLLCALVGVYMLQA